ncbi:CAP domain-containing protein [Paenibacillus sp. HJGM_3]|uniref:CAP domain-containing protein n=1 Tax=Paenibacillus sp. HJGM_3 TaxID=3379816 RepID=UPI00385D86B8
MKKFSKQLLAGVLAVGVIGGAAGVGSASAATLSDLSKNTGNNVQVYYGFKQLSLADLLNGNFNLAEQIQKMCPGLNLQIPDIQLPGLPEVTQPTTPTTPTTPSETPATPTPAPTTKPTPAPTPFTPKPTPTPTPKPTQPSTGTESSFANQVVNLVNQERAKAGLSALTSDAALTNMAMDKAKDMYNRNYFDHTSPTFGSPFDMMKSYNIPFRYAGENIAKGQRTPQEVMTAWMNSAGHRQNILSPNFTKIGVAYYNGEWVQEFTG